MIHGGIALSGTHGMLGQRTARPGNVLHSFIDRTNRSRHPYNVGEAGVVSSKIDPTSTNWGPRSNSRYCDFDFSGCDCYPSTLAPGRRCDLGPASRPNWRWYYYRPAGLVGCDRRASYDTPDTCRAASRHSHTSDAHFNMLFSSTHLSHKIMCGKKESLQMSDIDRLK